LAFVTTASATSAAAHLRRLAEAAPQVDRILLVTDGRQPLKVGAAGQRHLGELQKLGAERFQRFDLSFAEYAGLDALEAVAGMARSGDLEIETAPGAPRRLQEADVIAS